MGTRTLSCPNAGDAPGRAPFGDGLCATGRRGLGCLCRIGPMGACRPDGGWATLCELDPWGGLLPRRRLDPRPRRTGRPGEPCRSEPSAEPRLSECAPTGDRTAHRSPLCPMDAGGRGLAAPHRSGTAAQEPPRRSGQTPRLRLYLLLPYLAGRRPSVTHSIESSVTRYGAVTRQGRKGELPYARAAFRAEKEKQGADGY